MSDLDPDRAVAVENSVASARRQERVGWWLQLVGAVWTALIGTGMLLLLVVLAFDQFVSGYAWWLPLAGATTVAIGPVMYGIGSWLRGELDRPVPGPRAR